jgi:hypothetical protein
MKSYRLPIPKAEHAVVSREITTAFHSLYIDDCRFCGPNRSTLRTQLLSPNDKAFSAMAFQADHPLLPACGEKGPGRADEGQDVGIIHQAAAVLRQNPPLPRATLPLTLALSPRAGRGNGTLGAQSDAPSPPVTVATTAKTGNLPGKVKRWRSPLRAGTITRDMP